MGKLCHRTAGTEPEQTASGQQRVEMYRVSEYYQIGSRLDPLKFLQDFRDLDEAKAFAEEAYARLKRVPESEQVRVCVVDESGRVPYIAPGAGTNDPAV